MLDKLKFKDFNLGQKLFYVGLLIWILLQLSRFIAFVLIGDINSGEESKAWMYPAYLDIFAAVTAIPLVGLVVRWRGLFTWTLTIVYLAISIVDHFGNFTTTGLVGPPSIVQEGTSPLLIPIIQTVLDFLFLVLLLVPKYRRLFFRLESKKVAL